MKFFKAGTGKNISRSNAGTTLVFILLCLTSVFMSLPLVYSLVQSIKPIEELFAFPPRFFVSNPTLGNFGMLFNLANSMWIPFSRFVLNSMIVSVFGTAAYVFIASMAAYPLALGEFKGKKAINEIIVQALLFTSPILAASQYMILSRLRLLNTYGAMILPSCAAPLGLFLMRQFMVQMIPVSLMESAKIDGAGNFRRFMAIVMPVVKPAWLTLIIFTFQSLWSGAGANYVYDEQLKVLPTVLSQIASQGIARAGVGAAASVLLMLPPIITFMLTQSQVVETMASSGIKE